MFDLLHSWRNSRNRVASLLIPYFFILGLGLPKSFSLLIILTLGVVITSSKKEIDSVIRSPFCQVTMSSLIFFGILFSIRQYQLAYWQFTIRSLSDVITYAFVPSLCFAAGLLLRKRSGDDKIMLALMIAFSLGALVFVVAGLIYTKQNLFDLFEKVQDAIIVPWGDLGTVGQNIRSVDQRSWLSMLLIPLFPAMYFNNRKQANWPSVILLAFGVFGFYLAYYVFHNKSSLIVLILAFSPYLYLLSFRLRVFAGILAVSVIPIILSITDFLCDERISLQLTFIRHIPEGFWGGRQIRFGFDGCPGQGFFVFGPPPSKIYLPHNIFLDTVNDVGVIPALFLLASSSLILVKLLSVLRSRADSAFASGNISSALVLQWGFLVVIVVQSMMQPFMYSDRLMFCMAFMYAGGLVSTPRALFSPSDL